MTNTKNKIMLGLRARQNYAWELYKTKLGGQINWAWAR